MVDRKQSFFEWMSSGAASFPREHYSFWAGAISFADTSSTGIVPRKIMKNSAHADNNNEVWALPNEIYLLETVYDKNLRTHLTASRNNVLSFLKWIDVGIQVFSGTLICGAVQHTGERLRDVFKDKSGFVAGTLGFLGGTIALIGRGGLLVTQVLAGAIRLPLAILSGTVGLFQGVMTTNHAKEKPDADNLHFSKLHLILTIIGDYVWPFAPRAAKAISFYLPEKDWKKIAFQHVDHATAYESRIRMSLVFRWVSMVSFTIGIILVALLATSTLGISGFATLPVIKPLVSATAFALNYAFGWAGLHITLQSAAAAPVLAGIVNWFSIGFFSKKAVVGIMLVGALSTFFSNILHMFKDNVMGTDQRGRLVDQFTTDSSFSQSAYFQTNDHDALSARRQSRPSIVTYSARSSNSTQNDSRSSYACNHQ